jgi:hypothetical protein
MTWKNDATRTVWMWISNDASLYSTLVNAANRRKTADPHDPARRAAWLATDIETLVTDLFVGARDSIAGYEKGRNIPTLHPMLAELLESAIDSVDFRDIAKTFLDGLE